MIVLQGVAGTSASRERGQGFDEGIAEFPGADGAVWADPPGELTDILLAELSASATAAEEALPEITSGRFDGLSGGELFTTSTAADIADFLEYVLGSDSRDVRFAFVDAYAQWAIDGAPAPQR